MRCEAPQFESKYAGVQRLRGRTLKIECFEVKAVLGISDSRAILLRQNRTGTGSFYIHASALSQASAGGVINSKLALVQTAGALDH